MPPKKIVKKRKTDPKVVTFLIVILILIVIYILAKTFFWIALGIALILLGAYVYHEFTKEDKKVTQEEKKS